MPVNRRNVNPATCLYTVTGFHSCTKLLRAHCHIGEPLADTSVSLEVFNCLPLHSAQVFVRFGWGCVVGVPGTRFHVFRLSGMPYDSGWLQLRSWWDEMELNHPSRMTADLQSAPLPLTVYHPMWRKQMRIETGLLYFCTTTVLPLDVEGPGIEPGTQSSCEVSDLCNTVCVIILSQYVSISQYQIGNFC